MIQLEIYVWVYKKIYIWVRKKQIYIWVHRKYLWSIEARSNFSHFNGKTWDISSKLWQRLAIVNFSFAFISFCIWAASVFHIYISSQYRFYTAQGKIFLVLCATNPHFNIYTSRRHREFSFFPNSPRFCILCYAHPIVMGLSIIRTFPF